MGDKMKNWFVVFVVALAATGCTTSMQMGHTSGGKLKNVDRKNYELGKMQTAYVGEQIISRKSYQEHVKKKSYQAQNGFSLRGGFLSTSINLKASAGEKFVIIGENEHGNPVVSIPGTYFMFGIDKNGHWDKTVMAPTFWLSPVGSGRQYTMEPSNTRFIPLVSKTPISKANYINHEIVFTGVGADGLNLLYREYTFGDMARSAYTQNLVYPTDAKEVRFRKYLIKVISVSSSEIKYIVKSE